MPLTSDTSRMRLIVTVGAIALAAELMPFSLTLLYPALHYLGPAFHTANVSWVVSIGLLAGGAVLPLAGKVADMIGKRKILLGSVCAFAAGTAICLFTTDFGLLLVGRALQGCVAAAIPCAYGLIRDVLPSRIVPIAVGVVSTGFGLSAILGPLVSGALIVGFGYRGVFVFELAYMVVLIPLLTLVVPESPIRAKQKLDVGGAVLLTLAAAAVMVLVSNAPTWGWTSSSTLGFLLAFLVFLGGFLLVEGRVDQPLISLRLLGSAKVLMTLLGAFLGMFAIAGYGYLIPQMLQTPRTSEIAYGFGLSALAVALYTLPQGVMAMVFGPVGGLVARRWGARYALMAGTGFLAVSLLLFAFFFAEPWQVLVLAGVEGIGFGLFYAGPPNLIIEAVPNTSTGISAGITNTVQQMGSAIGTAVVGAVLAGNVIDRNPATHQVVYSTGGYRIALLAGGVAALLAVMVAALMQVGRGTRPRRQAVATRERSTAAT